MNAKIIAIDIGSVRVGVAISDGLGLLAHPLKTLKWKNSTTLAANLQHIISENNSPKLVVGVPYNMKGGQSEQTKKVLEIIEELKLVLKIPLELIDERLTTKLAENMLRDSGKKASRNRQIIDQIAAVNILQTYLDKNRL